MTRKELITSNEYVIAGMQLNLLNLIEDYMRDNNLTRQELATKLNVTKGYVSQILNASFDHKLSKVVELALACDMVPLLFFKDAESVILTDERDESYELVTVPAGGTPYSMYVKAKRDGSEVPLPDAEKFEEQIFKSVA